MGERRPFAVRSLAMWLIAAGSVLLAGAVALGAVAVPGMVGGVVALDVVGGLCMLGAAAVVFYDRIVGPAWLTEVATARGLSVVDTVPPGVLLHRLLRRVYGDHPENSYIVSGVLGGAGDSVDDGNLSISTATSVRYELRTTTPGYYELITTVDFTFRSGLRDHILVIFATCDPGLRDILVAGCDRPLFDWTVIPDIELFRNVEEESLRAVDVGVRYLDPDGAEFVRDPEALKPTWVDVSEWRNYLVFFRQPVGQIEQREPEQYLDTLKIFEVDLSALAVPDHPMHSVTGMTLRYSTRQPDGGNCFWQPAFPCLIDHIEFDAVGLETEIGTNGLEFTVLAFLPAADLVVQNTWVTVDKLGRFPIGSWALPGHGFTLLWRPHHLDDGNAA